MRVGELTLLVDVELGAYESKTVSRTMTMDTARALDSAAYRADEVDGDVHQGLP